MAYKTQIKKKKLFVKHKHCTSYHKYLPTTIPVSYSGIEWKYHFIYCGKILLNTNNNNFFIAIRQWSTKMCATQNARTRRHRTQIASTNHHIATVPSATNVSLIVVLTAHTPIRLKNLSRRILENARARKLFLFWMRLVRSYRYTAMHGHTYINIYAQWAHKRTIWF